MAHFQRVLPLLVILFVKSAAPQSTSICQTMQYRALSPMLQNEHQCMILERLQEDFYQDRNEQKDQYDTLIRLVNSLNANLKQSMTEMIPTSRDSAKAIPSLKGIPLVRDCDELQRNGITISGVYPIRLPSRNIVNVWCDMDLGNGGWTVIQRRKDGSINFTRSWDDYAFGFGNPNTEYWFGNDNIYRMTNYANYSLRVDLWDWDDNHVYALYDYFRVDGEKEFFRLKVKGYSGNAGDALSAYHDNMKFSTIDNDNDDWYLSCARKDQSGWWFRSCGFASLNGVYVQGGQASIAPDGVIKGVIWYNWKNDYSYSMKRTEMKIKPLVSVNIDKETERLNKQTDTTTSAENDVSSGSGDIIDENMMGQKTLRELSKTLSPIEFKEYKDLIQSGLNPEKFKALQAGLLKKATTVASHTESTMAADEATADDYDYDEYDLK